MMHETCCFFLLFGEFVFLFFAPAWAPYKYYYSPVRLALARFCTRAACVQCVYIRSSGVYMQAYIFMHTCKRENNVSVSFSSLSLSGIHCQL